MSEIEVSRRNVKQVLSLVIRSDYKLYMDNGVPS